MGNQSLDLELSVQQMDYLAAEVVRRLNGSVISSALPAETGKDLRGLSDGGIWDTSHWIGGAGRAGFSVRYLVNADGLMRLEMTNTAGRTFWRGTFIPEKEISDAPDS